MWGDRKIFWGFLKKSHQKNLGKYGQKGNFRHISEIYELEHSFFRSKKSKKQVSRSNFLFSRSKKSKK